MGAVLSWILRVSIAAVKWSWVHPVAALAVAGGLRITADYLRKQQWAGSDILADLTYGTRHLYTWPAVARLITIAARGGASALIDYIKKLLTSNDGVVSPNPWGLAPIGGPIKVGRIAR